MLSVLIALGLLAETLSRSINSNQRKQPRRKIQSTCVFPVKVSLAKREGTV